METNEADNMNISKKVSSYISRNNMTMKEFVEKYDFSRPTIYRRLKNHNWSYKEVQYLKAQKIIK